MAFSLALHAGLAPTPRINLGIDGLPEEISALASGGLYAIRAILPEIRCRLIVQTVLRSMNGQRDTAIVSTAAEKLVDVLDEMTEGSYRKQRIRVFERPAQSREALQRYGAEQFIREIEGIDLPAGGVLLVDGADELFTSTPPSATADQTHAYRVLMQDLAIIGIFLFQQREAPLLASPNRGLSRRWLSGVAELNGELGRLSWDVDHWDSDSGTAQQRRFGVFLRERNPWLTADGSELDMFSERISGATDESSVFYTRATPDGEGGLPADWIPLDGYAEVLPATENTIGATIILHYAHSQDLRELAAVIHASRLRCGRGIKILVRETRAHLRYNEELLLMQVGASAVVYQDHRLARLLNAVESLRGHCHAGPIAHNLDSAMASLAPQQMRGYVSPRVFCGLVRAALAKTRDSALPHALLRLRIRQDRAHLDALTAWHLKRANDLVTADEKDVYLFLFGCREPDIDPTLYRLLDVPASMLFSEQTRWQQCDSMLGEIESLAERAERQPFVDFSLLLPVNADRRARQTDKTHTAAQTETPAAGEVHTAPLVAPMTHVPPLIPSIHPSCGAERPAQPAGERSVSPICLRVLRRSD